MAFANIKYNGDLVPRDDHKYVLSITKKMIKTYQDIMGGGGGGGGGGSMQVTIVMFWHSVTKIRK